MLAVIDFVCAHSPNGLHSRSRTHTLEIRSVASGSRVAVNKEAKKMRKTSRKRIVSHADQRVAEAAMRRRNIGDDIDDDPMFADGKSTHNELLLSNR